MNEAVEGVLVAVRLLPATGSVRPDERGALSSFSGQLGLVVGASAVAGVAMAATGDMRIPLGLLGFTTLAVLGFVRPAVFLGVFLATRPLLDAFSDKQFVHGLTSANPAGVVAVLLVAMALVALSTSRRLFVPRGTTVLMLVLVLSVFSAAWALKDLRGVIGTEPITELIRLSAFVAIYLLAANLFATPRRTQLVFTIVALSAVPPAVIGIAQWIHGLKPEAGLTIGRVDSTFVGPNAFAAYLATAALLLIAATPQLPRRVRLPSLALILVALVGTYSREGWVMFLLGILLLGWRRHRLVVVAAAAGAAALVFAVPAVHDRVIGSSGRVVSSSGVRAAPTYESFDWRIGNWEKLLEKYRESPVVGFGLRTTPYVNPRRTEFLAPPSAGFEAHNLAVRVLVEGGPVLLLAYIALFAAMVGEAIRLARARWPLQRLGTVVLVLWVLAIVVGLTTDDPLSNTTMTFALFALAGSLEGARRTWLAQAAVAEGR
ncbi:MAG TPA: O-antigen ligase family protein [Thermoleophilaceae bacterium]